MAWTDRFPCHTVWVPEISWSSSIQLLSIYLFIVSMYGDQPSSSWMHYSHLVTWLLVASLESSRTTVNFICVKRLYQVWISFENLYLSFLSIIQHQKGPTVCTFTVLNSSKLAWSSLIEFFNSTRLAQLAGNTATVRLFFWKFVHVCFTIIASVFASTLLQVGFYVFLSQASSYFIFILFRSLKMKGRGKAELTKFQKCLPGRQKKRGFGEKSMYIVHVTVISKLLTV